LLYHIWQLNHRYIKRWQKRLAKWAWPAGSNISLCNSEKHAVNEVQRFYHQQLPITVLSTTAEWDWNGTVLVKVIWNYSYFLGKLNHSDIMCCSFSSFTNQLFLVRQFAKDCKIIQNFQTIPGTERHLKFSNFHTRIKRALQPDTNVTRISAAVWGTLIKTKINMGAEQPIFW